MKEGAWINVATGKFEWITEHCDWMKNHENAERIGLPENVFRQIKDMPNDYNGPKREKILRAVMDAGFVRVRGHGPYIGIEFTAATKVALGRAAIFCEKCAGRSPFCISTNSEATKTKPSS
jgi:hypothetical protein